ncbi:hypothetical protein HNE_1571 [Hyphomonas neptunium ATCC 15444]|uniref:Uncharacterized protein n=1 Tax=Hyphomonas neptunium (strain ATCC 15444) TaxID=228405 RepID=Q0C1W1_HYPNA|nr:hypothetical protein HNE_1571 [Hyphomonas neptunium ATCC 15444]
MRESMGFYPRALRGIPEFSRILHAVKPRRPAL